MNKKNKQYCRVCGEWIGLMGWAKHVEKHKKMFMIDNHVINKPWWKIKWEDVVLFYNPSEARPIDQPIMIKEEPKSLMKFL